MSEQNTSASEIKAELQKGLRLFKAFEHGERVLTALEGAEQNERELRAKAAASKAELTKLEGEIDVAKRNLATIERNAAETQEAAEQAGLDIRAQADAYAKMIKAEADAASSEAKRQAKAKIDAANNEVHEAKQTLEQIRVEQHEAEQKLAAAREQIKKLLG